MKPVKIEYHLQNTKKQSERLKSIYQLLQKKEEKKNATNGI